MVAAFLYFFSMRLTQNKSVFILFIDMCKTFYQIFYSVCILFCALASVSCSNTKSSSVAEDQLFSLKYGSFDNELTLFSLNKVGEINTSIAMRDGFFYIANSEAKKIIETNSYGSVLNLFYNKETNPVPDFADKENTAVLGTATQKAVEYPFNKIGPIAVDSRKYLYVTDTLPIERQQQDDERGLHLAEIVLIFDEDGGFVNYLGQNGRGGDPFPAIKAIYTNAENELIVVCYTNSGLDTYWFSSSGDELFTIHFSSANIPNPYSENDGETFITLDNVVPDYNSKRLHIKADYYTTSIDSASKVLAGVNFDATILHTYDIDSLSYVSSLEISPYTETSSDTLAKVEYNEPYNFMGVTENGWFFFMIADDFGYTIQMVQADGQKILKRHLDFDKSKILYYTFNLSNNGIISALFAKKDEAIVNWWRTDQQIDAILKS